MDIVLVVVIMAALTAVAMVVIGLCVQWLDGQARDRQERRQVEQVGKR